MRLTEMMRLGFLEKPGQGKSRLTFLSQFLNYGRTPLCMQLQWCRVASASIRYIINIYIYIASSPPSMIFTD